jgi:hypothetical protein
MIKLVETEPTSPFDALWRDFPQLKNSTLVGRMGCAWRGDDGEAHSSVRRTFRLLDGSYIQITSTEEGDELAQVSADRVEIYKDVWNRLGRRAWGKPTDHPHGIVFASDLFLEQTEDRLERLGWMDP